MDLQGICENFAGVSRAIDDLLAATAAPSRTRGENKPQAAQHGGEGKQRKSYYQVHHAAALLDVGGHQPCGKGGGLGTGSVGLRIGLCGFTDAGLCAPVLSLLTTMATWQVGFGILVS